MNKIIFPLILTLVSYSICDCQKSQLDSLTLEQVIVDFKQSIISKDSVSFNNLFFNGNVPFIGIMSEITESTIQKDYPDFQGISVSNNKKFISQICENEKKQIENFYSIKIDTDGNIASISFDYSFISEEKIIQWGNEKWNLIKIENDWLITNVIYSIHFPDIEEFPSKYLDTEEK